MLQSIAVAQAASEEINALKSRRSCIMLLTFAAMTFAPTCWLRRTFSRSLQQLKLSGRQVLRADHDL